MHFFGRLSFLVDENAHAVHFFISALLQLLDRYALQCLSPPSAGLYIHTLITASAAALLLLMDR